MVAKGLGSLARLMPVHEYRLSAFLGVSSEVCAVGSSQIDGPGVSLVVSQGLEQTLKSQENKPKEAV